MGDTASPDLPRSTRSARSTRQALHEDQRRHILGLLALVAGIVLAFAPWVRAGGPTAGMEGHRNELGVGLVVIFAAALRFAGRAGRWSDLVLFLSGVWMVVAPWALSLGDTRLTEGSRILDRVVGIALVLLAAASRLLARRVAREGERDRARPEAEPGPE